MSQFMLLAIHKKPQATALQSERRIAPIQRLNIWYKPDDWSSYTSIPIDLWATVMRGYVHICMFMYARTVMDYQLIWRSPLLTVQLRMVINIAFFGISLKLQVSAGGYSHALCDRTEAYLIYRLRSHILTKPPVRVAIWIASSQATKILLFYLNLSPHDLRIIFDWSIMNE